MGSIGTLCSIATAFAAVVIAVPAQAASLDELAREAVFDLCPDLMEIETPLQDEPSIKARGYKFVGSRDHHRAGHVDVVSLEADDGAIQIANSRDTSFCQVSFSGEGAQNAFASSYADRDVLADDWFEDPAALLEIKGADMVSLRTPAFGGLYLGVQFVDMSAVVGDAAFVIQQYVLEED